MDPFAAVSFAGNILQFIEFATKLVKEGKEIYRSADGVIQENLDLELITLDLKQFTNGLTPPQYSRRNVSADEKRLLELAAACQRTSDTLLRMLQKLQLPEGTRHLKLQSIRVALRASRKEKEAGGLQKRLDTLRDSLNSHLLKQLSNQQSEIVQKISEVHQEDRRLQINTADALDAAKTEILYELRQMSRGGDIDHDLFTTAAKMAELGEAGTRAPKEQAIIRSLHFATIKVRFDEIKPAHARTFEWAFQDDRIPLRKWLETEPGIFWVSGKAGSGKSTWMKFLCRHPETMAALRRWAEPKKAVFASYFFWNAGYAEQKSQEGLLRSLLFQIFQQAPKLIEMACQSRWDDVSERASVWTLSELSAAFRALAQHSSLPVKLCCLVDGLDEFQPSVKTGDHADLLQLLRDVSVSSDIKLCLSTRPWPFVLSELSRSQRKLYMQDLTVDDMRIYARETLENNEDFRNLRMREPECVDLVEQITAKAQGVFLWVYLVVRSLVKGLESQGTTAELLQRLDAMPEGLEKSFERSIQSIEPVYQTQSARILQFALTAVEPLSILAYHFLDLEMHNSDYALGVLEPLDVDRNLYESVKRRLHARSKDLLEVTPWEEFSERGMIAVNYLHRTVKEFLEDSADVSAMLRERAQKFDPLASICKAFLALVKTYPNYENVSTWFPLVEWLLYYTHRVELHNGVALSDVLDEVNRHLEQRLKTSDGGGHWTNLSIGGQTPLAQCGISDFLGLAILTRQKIYVERRLSAGPKLLTANTGCLYLYYALCPQWVLSSKLSSPLALSFSRTDPNIVRMLLEFGSDPNAPFEPTEIKAGTKSHGKSSSPWQMYLRFVDSTVENRILRFVSFRENVAAVVEVLLQHGADPTARVRSDGRAKVPSIGRVRRAPDVLDEILEDGERRRLLHRATRRKKAWPQSYHERISVRVSRLWKH